MRQGVFRSGVPGQHDFEVACFLMEEVPLQGIIGVTLAPKPRDPHRAECFESERQGIPNPRGGWFVQPSTWEEIAFLADPAK